jgi:2,4-dienoyl-CoA reductase (NADPH2)
VGLTARLRQNVSVPVVAANRINTPELAEAILAKGQADLVALARPLLADPDFVVKARAGKPAAIAPCIACNQACLDHTFAGKLATCLVNPAACREAEYDPTPAARALTIAVVGGGAAGMACAITAAKRGQKVVLFEQAKSLGGQMNLAARVPGKEEFAGLLAWFEHQLLDAGVELRLGQSATPETLRGFDKVVLATGLIPRRLDLMGTQNAPDYAQILQGHPLGPSIAVIGAGGIGFDVATALVTQGAQAHYTGP